MGLRIGIDCDGVLRDLIPCITDSIKETHPQHADKILDDGKIVKWKYDGKTYTKPRHGKSEVFRSNATNEPSEIRPTILMDITFNGFTYKDVEVGLDQRPRSGSDLLVNRDLMRLMNLSVNPNRTFVLSKRLRPIEKGGQPDNIGFAKK